MTSGSRPEENRAATSDRSSPSGGQESALLDDVAARFAELRNEFKEYCAAKIARLKLSFWQTVVAAVSVALGAGVAIAFVVTAVVFVFSGLAGWLGEVTSKPYLGSLFAGLIGLVVVGVALLVVRAVLMKRALGTKGAARRD